MHNETAMENEHIELSENISQEEEEAYRRFLEEGAEIDRTVSYHGENYYPKW